MHFTRTQTFITNVKSHHSLCERTDAVVQRWGNMSGVGVQSKQPGASSSSVCAGEQRPEPHDTEQKHESPFQCLQHLYTIKQHDLNYRMLYTEKKSRQKCANVWMKTIAAYDQLQWFNSKLCTQTHTHTHTHIHIHTHTHTLGVRTRRVHFTNFTGETKQTFYQFELTDFNCL